MNSTTHAGRPFHRYEYLEDGEWHGIFGLFDPSERRFLNQFIKEPAWYKNNPGQKSEAWFTDRGFQRYGPVIEQTLQRHKANWGRLPQIRIRETMELKNVVMHGTIQCISIPDKTDTPKQ